MDSLPKDVLLEFNTDTVEAVRKEFNLDKPGRVDDAINILDDWVKKQTHFVKKDFPRGYLERTIISCKGSVEKAKVRIDRLCTFKTIMPSFFVDTFPKEEFAELHTFLTDGYLPNMSPDHCRIYICKLIGREDADIPIFSYFRYTIVLSEYLKMNDYANGYLFIIDFTDVNLMSLITKLNVAELRQTMTILLEGYGMRLKGIHVISSSKAISVMVSILKQVLSEKLGSRIQSHKTIETVYEHVPKNIMPVEYGGEERSLKELNENWIQVISSKEFMEYILEMNEAKTIESCRQTESYAEEYIGMPGSFRSLNVD